MGVIELTRVRSLPALLLSALLVLLLAACGSSTGGDTNGEPDPPDAAPDVDAGLRWQPSLGVEDATYTAQGFTILADGTWLTRTAEYANLVFTSGDEGETWSPISDDLPACGSTSYGDFLAHPSDAGVVLSVCGHAVHRSTDGGRTWSEATVESTPFPNHEFHAWHSDDVVRYADIASVDAGATWHAVEHPDAVVSDSDATHWWASEGTDLLESTDAGATWTTLDTSVTAAAVGGGLTCGSEPIDAKAATALADGTFYLAATQTCTGGAVSNLLLTSGDGGGTWSLAAEEPGADPVFPDGSVLTVNPHDPSILHLTPDGAGSSLLLTTNGGTSWEEGSVGSTAERVVRYLPPSAGALLITGEDGTGTHVSTDGGRTWSQDLCDAPGRPYGTNLVTVDGAPNVLYFGACVSTDGGRTWTGLEVGNLDHLGTEHAYFTQSSDPVVRFPHGAPADTKDDYAAFRGFHPLPGEHLVVDGDGRLLVTASGNGTGPNANPDSGAVASSDPTSEPWAVGFPYGPVTAIAPSNPDRWYLYMQADRFEPHVYVSSDGGLDVTHDTSLPGGLLPTKLVVSHQDEDLVFAAADGGLFKSADAAQTWREAGSGLGDAPEVLELVVDPTAETTLYAATPAGIFVTHDEGASWTDSTAAFGLARDVVDLEMSPDGSTVYAALQGDGILRRVGDGGWEDVTGDLADDDVHDVEIDPTDGDVLYAGTDAGVWQSTDGGDGWTPVSVGLPFSKVVDLAVAPDGGAVYALVQDASSRLTSLVGMPDMGTNLYVGTPSDVTGRGSPVDARQD